MLEHTNYASSFDNHASEQPPTITYQPPPVIRLQDDTSYPSPSTRPSSSSNNVVHLQPYSPGTTPAQSSSSSSPRASGSEPPDEEKDSSTEVQWERSSSVASNKSEEKVEKRKRSRVTPEQLQHLERFFLLDRSPTAARRREISELLGMQERQTQIWFQNRRAKAKLLDGRQQHRRMAVELPAPDSPPHLSTGFQAELQNLIHEDEAVTIIPCTDLTIGSWRRIATSVAKHDLVAYVSDVKRCLTWFIQSVGFGFKMEIPFDTIVETKFTNAAPGSGLASFFLSQPPLFYLENAGSQSVDGPPERHWKRCSDWTEGQQASRVLRHDLVGSAPQLSHLLRNLQSQPPADLSLRPPSYRPEQPIPPVTPMELPPPPMANLSTPIFRYQHLDIPESAAALRYEKRSSFSSGGLAAPAPESYSSDNNRPVPYSAPGTMSVSFGQQQANLAPYRRASTSAFGSDGSVYSSAHHTPLQRSHTADNFSEISITQGVTPRPYSAQSIPRSVYGEPSQRTLQPFQTQGEDLRMRRLSVPSTGTASLHPATSHEQLIPPHLNPQHQQHFITQPSPSPPLLTTPYHPPPHLLNRSGHTEQMNTTPSPLNTSFSNVDGYEHYQA
ncbi:hypothetical protein H0H92_014623 [Tricholoma furcatifolium]|nr:hypothetical protein H0H92_014623 [Tricholoma furcatifolium]